MFSMPKKCNHAVEGRERRERERERVTERYYLIIREVVYSTDCE